MRAVYVQLLLHPLQQQGPQGESLGPLLNPKQPETLKIKAINLSASACAPACMHPCMHASLHAFTLACMQLPWGSK